MVGSAASQDLSVGYVSSFCALCISMVTAMAEATAVATTIATATAMADAAGMTVAVAMAMATTMAMATANRRGHDRGQGPRRWLSRRTSLAFWS